VHDLVEAYALDTDSFGIDEASKKAKDEREHKAFLRIEKEFKDMYPWIPEMIKKYEALDTKEARFVKTVDKLMTKITHILNKGAMFKKKNMDANTMWSFYQMKVKEAEERYGQEFPEVLSMMDELIREAKRVAYEE
jgi:5'-deoxynucleotidase YfbR-like HD superfamily hydrolase